MQLDIALIIIIAIFTILGFKNGFVHTLFSTCGWLIAIVAALFARDAVASFMMDKTGVYGWYRERVYNICAKFTSVYTNNLTGWNTGDGAGELTGGAIGATTGGAVGDLTGGAIGDPTGGAIGDLTGSAVYDPTGAAIGDLTGGAIGDLTGGAIGGSDGSSISGALEMIGGAMEEFSEKLTQVVADQLASASFVVLCFIVTVLVIRFFLLLLTLALSRKRHGGFVGALDATGGVFLGAAQGFIVVFIVLLLILPVSLAINPWLFEKISDALNTSFFARTLFMTNPLVPIIEGFAPEMFDPTQWMRDTI
jgi:uncharacterized membrane protein required for colicin V production